PPQSYLERPMSWFAAIASSIYGPFPRSHREIGRYENRSATCTSGRRTLSSSSPDYMHSLLWCITTSCMMRLCGECGRAAEHGRFVQHESRVTVIAAVTCRDSYASRITAHASRSLNFPSLLPPHRVVYSLAVGCWWASVRFDASALQVRVDPQPRARLNI